MTKSAETLEELLSFCQKNRRICPMPQQWQKLYEMLPNAHRVGNGWEPSLPLILAAWQETPALLKMMRLREHLEWANEHGSLHNVSEFLRNLREDKWFHSGE